MPHQKQQLLSLEERLRRKMTKLDNTLDQTKQGSTRDLGTLGSPPANTPRELTLEERYQQKMERFGQQAGMKSNKTDVTDTGMQDTMAYGTQQDLDDNEIGAGNDLTDESSLSGVPAAATTLLLPEPDLAPVVVLPAWERLEGTDSPGRPSMESIQGQ